MNLVKLKDYATEVRDKIIYISDGKRKIHYGGSLSCVEIMVALYHNILNLDKDKFILSKGHACLTQYIVLAQMGLISFKELNNFKEIDSNLQGHPDMNMTKGVDMSTGSLGQGLSVAVGLALGKKMMMCKDEYVYCLVGDGECQSGQIWEAAMAGAHFNLDNLIVFIDDNKIQVDGFTNTIMNVECLSERWKAFNWHVQSVDGHDFLDIFNAIDISKRKKNKASIIILNTVKGKGISFMENKNEYHSASLSKEKIKIGGV